MPNKGYWLEKLLSFVSGLLTYISILYRTFCSKDNSNNMEQSYVESSQACSGDSAYSGGFLKHLCTNAGSMGNNQEELEVSVQLHDWSAVTGSSGRTAWEGQEGDLPNM